MKIIHPGHLEYRFCIFGCQILCITYLAIMPQLPPIPAVETPADNIVPSPESPEKQNDPGQPVRKPFKCEQCDFSLDTKHSLSVHNGKAHRLETASERLLKICHRCEGKFYYNDDQRVIVGNHCETTTYVSDCDSLWHCFYRTRVRSLAMLVTNWLTHWLPFSKLDWCDPGTCRWQLKTCWSCYCCRCWW